MILDLSIKFSQQKAKDLLDKYIAKEYKIELKKILPKRTIQQNKYLHVLFSLIGAELGNTVEEVKQIIKHTCPFMHYEKNGIVFLRSTADLDTREMGEFIDWICNHYAMQNINLPSAEDYRRDWAAIDEYVRSYREYL